MTIRFREFLTGFQKRKQERKVRARKEIEDKLKIERKTIKSEIRSNILEQFKKSFAPIPEHVDDEDKEEEYEDDEVQVKIVELSKSDMARENNWVGENRPKTNDSDDDDDGGGESDAEMPEAVPGMSISTKKESKAKQSREKMKIIGDLEKKDLKTKKDLNRMVQSQTQTLVKQCKAFKMKNQLDRSKMKKKARREKNKKLNVLKQQSKKRGGKHLKMVKNKNKPRSHK